MGPDLQDCTHALLSMHTFRAPIRSQGRPTRYFGAS